MVCVRLHVDSYEKLDYLLMDIVAGTVKPDDDYELEIHDLGQYIARAKRTKHRRDGSIMEIRETLVTARATITAEWTPRDDGSWTVWLCIEPHQSQCDCNCYCDE